MEKGNTKNFIERAIIKHNNKYSYLLTNYVNLKTKVKIICPIHGVFEQTPKNHLIGCGCQKCVNNIKYDKETFVNISNIKHNNKYDYSESNYINSVTPVKIICPIHGVFNQTPNTHYKCGCQKCYFEKPKSKLTIETFISKSINIHGDVYIYDKSICEHSHSMVKIVCPVHGEYSQMAYSHMQGKGCPVCKKSKGEKAIHKFLMGSLVKFIPQKKFNDCLNVKHLSFDFYLPDYNMCIEYDGKQHFEPVNRFGGLNGFEKTKKNDKIKTDYCFKKDIKLIRIAYTDNITQKLKQIENEWKN